MHTTQIKIGTIPAILWGPPSRSLFLAVHGDMSHKTDEAIQILAEQAVEKGHQVLSFDLPEHGDRKTEPRLCDARNCVEDLAAVMDRAHILSDRISLFGCSMGAFFSMLAYEREPIEQALFLSPVVDMVRIIRNMMSWFDVSEERLEREREIATPVKTLYWDYYQYVLARPVRWDKPTALLYGAKDNLCERDYVVAFADRTGSDMTVLEGGEHFFHTEEQLAFLRRWLGIHLKGYHI